MRRVVDDGMDSKERSTYLATRTIRPVEGVSSGFAPIGALTAAPAHVSRVNANVPAASRGHKGEGHLCHPGALAISIGSIASAGVKPNTTP